MDPQLGGGGHAPGIPELDQDPGGGALDRGRDRRHLRGRGAMLGLCPALGGGVRPPAPGAGSAGQAGDPLPAGGRREAGQVRGAGRAYLRALAALQRAPGDPLNAVYWGQGLSLATEIPLRLQQSLSAICLQALPLQTSLRQGQRAARALRVRDREGWPLPGLPLAYRLVRGAGDLEPAAPSDRDGIACALLRRVQAAEPEQLVQVRLHLLALPRLISDQGSSPWCGALPSRWPACP